MANLFRRIKIEWSCRTVFSDMSLTRMIRRNSRVKYGLFGTYQQVRSWIKKRSPGYLFNFIGNYTPRRIISDAKIAGSVIFDAPHLSLTKKSKNFYFTNRISQSHNHRHQRHSNAIAIVPLEWNARLSSITISLHHYNYKFFLAISNIVLLL